MPTETKEKKAKVLTVEEWEQMPRALPKSWTEAAGILRRKKKEIERHIKAVRREWDRCSAKKRSLRKT